MPVNEDGRNNPGGNKGKPGKGNPSDTGQPKAGAKPVNNLDNLEENQELQEKHMDDIDMPGPDALKGSHPNRNYDKPDLNKPAYGGSH
jgi:hypothetical protein